MPRIGDLDADRAGIYIGLACPGRHARMPRAAGFGHHLDHAAVFEHQIMGGYFAARGTQTVERDLRIEHARIVQQDHIRPHPAAALAMIRRRAHLGDHAGFCWEHTPQHGPEIRSRSRRYKPLCPSGLMNLWKNRPRVRSATNSTPKKASSAPESTAAAPISGPDPRTWQGPHEPRLTLTFSTLP